MSDSPTYYCARCLAHLPESGAEESWCPKCDAPIESPSDVIDHDEWARRSHADRIAWSDAVRDGLIIPPTGEAAP